jgi:hypothetical protein
MAVRPHLRGALRPNAYTENPQAPAEPSFVADPVGRNRRGPREALAHVATVLGVIMDLFFVLLTTGLLALSFGLIRLCDRV